jgi:recombination protein RecT
MTTIATRDEQPTVGQFITRLQPEIARALPRGMDADRIARLALTVVRQSDMEAQKIRRPQNSLANCKPESFAGALLTAAALGLEPGVNGEAYLVPYKGECTLIVGYQGYAKLFFQHPLAAHLDAQAVRENDEFDYWYGVNPDLVHKPAKTGDRGKITHYWAAARLSTGASMFVVLSADEVKALRGGKVGSSGNIPDPQHWMERKTVLRQLFKLLPKSTSVSAALTVDDQRGSVLAEREVPQGIGNGVVPALPPTAATRDAGDSNDRVTAAEIVDQGTGVVLDQCPVCGAADGQPHDDDVHAEAGV